jgi:hypothetical protein
MEVIDWFSDIGAPLRDWSRRLEALDRYAVARMRDGDALPRTSGCWVVRATQRNRELIAQHAHLFRSRFPGKGLAWLEALKHAGKPMPDQPAVMWISVDGSRLYPAPFGPAGILSPS